MRAALFTFNYYLLSVLYVLVSVPFLILPGHTPVRLIIRSYTRAMNLNLLLVAGIRKEVRGRSRLPEGAFVLAAKHQSWGDGYLVYPEVDRLAFVTGDHLEKFPLVGGILRKRDDGVAMVARPCVRGGEIDRVTFEQVVGGDDAGLVFASHFKALQLFRESDW